MKLIHFLLPLALTPCALAAACSPTLGATDQAPPAQISQISTPARAEMARINAADFAPLTDAQSVPQLASIELPSAAPVAETPAADASVGAEVQYNAALVRIETLLDRAHFSPGVIDGYDGENVRKAVSAYQAAHTMPVNGQADNALLQTLTAQDAGAALVTYVITSDDVRGPFAPVPHSLEAMSHLDHLGYERASEALAERFHMDENLLRKLNPGVDFAQAGGQIVVTSPGGDLSAPVASIVIDKTEKSLRAFDVAGQLLAFYPASIGSPDAPAPSGDYAVRAVAFNPTYHYDPARLPTFGHPNHGALAIAAGPNNPVGSVWIALTLDTYGIHGSPEAQLVSKTQSHGCVRLTNWDATELGHAVRAGVPVSFRDGGVQAVASSQRG